MLNSYYHIAMDDYLYGKHSLDVSKQLGKYNTTATIFAQSAEKFLKEVIEVKFADDSSCIPLLKSHNLRSLVNKIKERYPDAALSSMECKWLGDFYFDARYPGENYVVVSEEDAMLALQITESILEAVNSILER